MSWIFHARFHFLRRFSRVIASYTFSKVSTCTESLHTIALGETRDFPALVHLDAAHETARHADVQGAIFLAGQNVDVVALHIRWLPGFLLSPRSSQGRVRQE